MLLQGTAIESFLEGMKEKIFTLGLNEWYEAMPRNIGALINNG